MNIKYLVLLAGCVSATGALASDAFSGKVTNPYTYEASVLADGVKLSSRLVECVYVMPEQISKLIFPKPVEEVSVNSMMINISKNPPESKENYLLISPKVAKGDVNMHVVMEGQTYTFRLLIGNNMVNYRKTYTVQKTASRSIPRVPALAPTEINTVNLIKMLTQALHEPNYSEIVSHDLGISPQGTTYMWNGVEVTLLDAWHYYKQDVVILRIEVHNPTSKAIYLSATQFEPYIANTKLDYLVTQQGTKVLLPSQTDVKYLFLQGYSLDIENARFEIRLPATGQQLKAE
jgi:hypothetical protein